MSSDPRNKNRRPQPKPERVVPDAAAGVHTPGSGLAASRSTRESPAAVNSLRLRRAVLGGVIVVAVLLAYANAFTTPFHFDDVESIVGNASIRDLSSFGWLRPPASGGETVSGRPVLNLSFAVNHAVGGLDVRGYHLVNVLIHALAALVLFGIVRRSCAGWRVRLHRRSTQEASPELAEGAEPREPEAGAGSAASASSAERSDSDQRASAWFAFAVSLLWALHPLHTGAVTYVVQRAESLAGLFYLLTLYGFIRAVESDRTGSAWSQKGTESAQTEKGRSAANRMKVGAQLAAPSTEPGPTAVARAASSAPTATGNGAAARFWYFVSVGACLLGMATKETVVTAPLLVLLYDRAFLSGSFRSAWCERRRYYLALAGTWLVLGVLVFTNAGRGGSAGLGSAVSSAAYLVTQAEALVHYLRLAIWPAGQVFDYGVATSRLADVWPQALLLVGLAGVAGRSLVRNRASGFLMTAFFLLLAPSSSLVPVATQTIAEHRMYLPLAVVIVLVGLAVGALPGRIARETRDPAGEPQKPAARLGSNGRLLTRRVAISAAMLAVVAAMALGAATFTRNRVYRSELALWSDTVAKRPDNPRAHHNLGVALLAAGRPDEASTAFRRAIALQPNHVFARTELGRLLVERDQPAEAVTHLRAALAPAPDHLAARVNLGRALALLGRPDEAAAEYEAVLGAEPQAVDARTNLAALLLARGEPARAVELLRDVLAAAPELAEAHYHLGLALESLGRDGEAAQALRTAAELRPAWAQAQLAWANVLARRGDGSGAERAYRAALAADPRLAAAHYGWGNLLARRRDFGPAIDAYRTALQLDPELVQARNNLANSLLVTGRLEEAIELYQRLLERQPEDVTVRRNLELARELLRQQGGASR